MDDELWVPRGFEKRASKPQMTEPRFSRGMSGLNAEAARALQSGRNAEPSDDPTLSEMRRNRRVTASSRSGGDLSFATGRPRDPSFFMENNQIFKIERDDDLQKLRTFCRWLYMGHPVIASAIDIFSKYPLTGMELVCFQGDTRVITENGTFSIRDLSGGVHNIITSGGKWAKADFDSYGMAQLHRIVLTKNGRTKDVYATAAHRWFVDEIEGPGQGSPGESNPSSRLSWDQVEEMRLLHAEGGWTQKALAEKFGVSQPMAGNIVRGDSWTRRPSNVARKTPVRRERKTIDLQPGDQLASAYIRNRVRESHPSFYGVAHGMIFGDGSRSSDGNGCYIDLFGEKDIQMLQFFPDAPRYDQVLREGANVTSVRVDGLPSFFKDRPSLEEATTYLYGWLAGYFAADGSVSKAGECILSSASLSNIEYAQTVCHRLGIDTDEPRFSDRVTEFSHGEIHRMWSLPIDGWSLTENFFKITEHRQRWIAKRSDERQIARSQWTVISVEETDRTEEVYCAKVPGTESFALEGNLLTGNCKDPALTDFYSDLFFDQLDYEDFMVEVLREYWTVGEAWPFGQFNELLGVWESDVVLDPNNIRVTDSLFTKDPRFEMRLPESIRNLLSTQQPRWQYEMTISAYPELMRFQGQEDYMPVSNVLLEQLKFKGHTFHNRGIPILYRGLRSIIQEEMLNNAQDSIADRLATPLILTKLGATASDLGTKVAWMPTDEEIGTFEESLDAALAADFRVITHHFGISMENVFRDIMPDFDVDFDRLMERQLQIFGMSKTMLSGADGGETYAGDALNRDLVSQLLTGAQRLVQRLFKKRMLVVAEAQEHFDYEVRNGKRYPIMEEILEVDVDGTQRIVEQPKLLVPDVRIRGMNMREEQDQRQFIEAAVDAGVPVSQKTRFVNINVDLEEERKLVQQEKVAGAIAEQETRLETFKGLQERRLPIPDDLEKDFGPKPLADDSGTEQSQSGASQMQIDDQPIPTLGDPVAPTNLLAPDADDQMPLPDGEEHKTENHMAGPQRNRIMDEGRTRPPESDEQRKGMPRRAGLIRTAAVGASEEVGGGYGVYMNPLEGDENLIDPETHKPIIGLLTHGPRHVGMRRFSVVSKDDVLGADEDAPKDS